MRRRRARGTLVTKLIRPQYEALRAAIERLPEDATEEEIRADPKVTAAEEALSAATLPNAVAWMEAHPIK